MIINEEIKDILAWLEPTLRQNQNPQDNIRYWPKTKTIFFEHIKKRNIKKIRLKIME